MSQSAVKKKKQPLHISVVIPVHREGRLLHHTLKSVERAISVAEAAGVSAEAIVVLDNVDSDTREYIRRFAKRAFGGRNFTTVRLSAGHDIGRAIDCGVSRATGDVVAVVGAKDLVSEDWLIKGYNLLFEAPEPTIVHPHYVLAFDKRDYLQELFSTTDRRFSKLSIAEFNPYPIAMITKTRVAKAYRYCPEDRSVHLEHGWAWNGETIAAGVHHVIAQETLYAKRYLKPNEAGPRSKGLLAPTTCLVPSSSRKLIHGEPTGPAENAPGRKNRILTRTRQAIDFMYRSGVSRKLRRIHPRVDDYLTSFRNETLHLLRPIEKPRPAIPAWILKKVQSMHEIDLRVFLSARLKQVIEYYTPRPGLFTESYWYFAERLSTDTDLLFIVPYLKNGGAEREIANLINAVYKLYPQRNVKIISTDKGGSPWAGNINERVKFLEPHPSFHALNEEDQARLLASLLIQLAPSKIHVVNSLVAYKTMERYSDLIAIRSQLFITIFSIDKTDEGRNTHMFTDTMSHAIDAVQTVFTDNQAVADELVDLMAIEKTKFSVLYQPTEIQIIDQSSVAIEERFTRSPLKVLWAGRLDRQKRPDVLIRIAKEAASQKREIEFHVYGSSAFDDTSYQALLRDTPEVTYHGPYEDGLKSLPLSDFDVFLMTSEWEGLPNVLLEAIVHGLLVIAPSVGGIGEVIKDGKTGYLVHKFDDVPAYLNALHKSANAHKSRELVRAAQNLIIEKHSPEYFERRVRREAAYLTSKK